MIGRARLLTLLGLGLALLGVDRPQGLGDVTDVRHWSYPDYTRVVIELNQPVTLKTDVRQLPADSRAGRPERLYLDLEGVWVGRRYLDGLAIADGLLRGVRIGQNTLTSIRLVLDLEKYERHRVLTLSHPDRLVVDVYGPREGGEVLRWPTHDAAPGTPRLPTGLRAIQTVVIDAGHGGRDPGAIGVGGVREKDVTLKIAKALGPRLEARGFRVVETRAHDRKLDLEERTAIAEAARGDLFVSLHANSAPRRSVRGVETYYLDENQDRHSLTVAARENGIERAQVNPLQRTLARLRVSEVSSHSQRLAETVQQQIVTGMPKRFRPIQDLGAKKGPFYVLFLSSMPAALVEAGFVTNRAEAKLLRDDAYLDALAEQIAEGLSRYRDSGSALAQRVAR
ncbi:MAG: N-acetylmuramoyl-L-alanine amidase [Myxococcales bacterium]|nr:N-acetylmuramoyl-L-alanine amidase [Myxococcales bacterium]MDH5307884.1 N-acetylmuramoyl-L-alanine amidase [Myxococcales bacterium]MDH5567758.1 N-acetylmuramoyl-L-alanine amidase [Myxococcales bacterium]